MLCGRYAVDGIVLMSDPRVAAVAVEECGEPLVDCRTRFHVDERRSDPEGHWAHLRAGVADRLARAERSLPYDWCWLLVEGYRSPARQREIYDGYAASLRRLRPEATEAELACAAARWVAPSHTAGHVAGAAVDLTVRTRDGTEVDMGCPEAATPEESAGACCTAAPDLPAHARRNRDAMIHALRSAGMVNYPTEWWHWSYGDRYWAFTTRARSAHYGPADPP
ncbi:D-alanyl-D-alanine dipeptidase [Streptomyces sp. Amel2xB2]|uniref:M15 family metallopeptidase n=1 Tax=Streptomyces sp. Amel2xB2 TaxID=1305829 RepID=UPI000DBA77F7|nr:M15 family metallopeptidase [Streptomyces sp. Amel2xB2]RAJ69648.1 D-alanyl-D-alanine dipeptidase [Streptomyces sp. Amel2xB2]